MASLLNNPIRKALASPFVAGLLVSSCVFALCANEAMAQRGGGRGGGGGASASRGGGGGGGGAHGGRQAKSSVSSGNRASSSAGSANRSGNTANRSGNTTNRTNNSSRTTNVGSNNNVNVNRGDVNIDVDGGYGGYGNGCCRARYPVAAGVAIGAVAGMTAAAVGSYYAALPPSCAMVTLAGVGYYQCGSAYYQQSMNGDTVVYVSVNP